MIRSVTFENYKSFKAKTKLDLKPITVLVGTNSSGKSSFIKLLGLLSQSYSHPRLGTFLTYEGPVVDMGDFKTISHRNLGEPITIELSISVFDSDELMIMRENDKEILRRAKLCVNSDLSLHFGTDSETLIYTEGLEIPPNMDELVLLSLQRHYREISAPIIFKKQHTEARLGSPDGPKISASHVLGITGTNEHTEEFISNSKLAESLDTILKIFSVGYGREFTKQEFHARIKEYLIKGWYHISVDGLRFSNSEIKLFISFSIPYANQNEQITTLPQELKYKLDPFNFEEEKPRVVDRILEAINDEANEPYRHLLLLETVKYIEGNLREYREKVLGFGKDKGEDEKGWPLTVQRLRRTLAKTLGSIRIVKPLRPTPQRFYTEAQLKNFILSTAIVDDLSESTLQELFKAVSQDLRTLGADYEVDFHKVSQSQFIPDLYALTLTDKKSNATQSYSDVGFGLSQIIPILITLRSCQSYHYSDPFVIIEQPELHLHPHAQARLADIFVDWLHFSPPNDNWVQLLLETHSEHLVRGFQVLVAKGKLSKDEIAIYYVDKDDKGNSFVKLIPLDDTGSFTEPWPEGFFDQGYLQAMELLAAQEN